MIDLVRPRRNMIVLEGPDGGGKSTLLQKLYENTGYKIASKAVTSEGTGVTNIKSYVRGHITQGFSSGCSTDSP
jgi:thymidylate kinase